MPFYVVLAYCLNGSNKQRHPDDALNEKAGPRSQRRVAHDCDRKGRQPTNHHKDAQQTAERPVKLRIPSHGEDERCEKKRQRR